MARTSPNRVTESRIAGVYVRFEYYWKKRDVLVVPDEADLKAADCYDVLKVWTVVAGWAVRFCAANRGWTVNGSAPVETLEED